MVPPLGSMRVRKMKMVLVMVPASNPAERTKLNLDHHWKDTRRMRYSAC